MKNNERPMLNPVGWFEIPVNDMQRAMHFYENILRIKMEHHHVGELEMAWFPMTEGQGAAGSLVRHKEWYKPPQNAKEGVLIYFNSPSGDLKNELSRIEKAGGRVVVPRSPIPLEGHGYIAIFLDSEGNRVALHSMQ